MRYLLDANVFMMANNLHYGLDFCPAFWHWLIMSNGQQKLFSIEKVRDEILACNDELTEWTKGLGEHFFLKPDQKVLKGMARVSQWVHENDYTFAAKKDFLQVADYWLISYGLAHDFVVVTHEKPADTRNKVKIPNVCNGLCIKVMTPFEMLRCERARFVLWSGA